MPPLAPPAALPVILRRGRVEVAVALEPLRIGVRRDGRPVVADLVPWARDGRVDDRFVRVTEGVVAHEELADPDPVVAARPLPGADGARRTFALRFASGRSGTLRVALPDRDVVHLDLVPAADDALPAPLRLGVRWSAP
ncbi:hypothetical protein ACVU7I_15540, partial [Patulibacter sp. S7RM1-6]